MKLSTRLSKWLLQDAEHESNNSNVSSDTPKTGEHKAPWWKVMCLTGVDYFSTLGYQPGIAFLAAGLLSPIATLILVAVTLLAALPTYSRVAHYSPEGQGSVSMLEKLFPGWKSKLLVLAFLGFAAMGFIITITLSAADAATHVVENPFIGHFLHSRMLVTFFLLTLLGGIFLKGFKEVIGLAVILVAVYLSLNTVLLGVGIAKIVAHPALVSNWWQAVLTAHPSFLNMLVVCVLVFPRLALGLSGFETGVMVMPLVDGGKADEECDENGKSLYKGRIANTRKLLSTAAIIMSVLLIASSIVTSMLVPVEAMQPGGVADGRALAYLAHKFMGEWFGTVYDLSTITILWFAGASAMAGLLNLVPRYLPRYGMAPEWTRAVRPLVLFFIAVSFFVTWMFGADVNSQSAAYATGVLVFLTAAAFSVTIAMWDRGFITRVAFAVITFVFLYTTAANIWSRPDGVVVAIFFVSAILITSLVSRWLRSTELRISSVEMDEAALACVTDKLEKFGRINLVAHKPAGSTYAGKTREMSYKHNIPEDTILLVEVKVSDSSDFDGVEMKVRGTTKGEGDHPVLVMSGPSVANAISALALHVRDVTEKVPDIYFGWTEGSPYEEAFNFLFFGQGEISWLAREVLRIEEPDLKKRPKVHVA